jgi:TPR repeat protein
MNAAAAGHPRAQFNVGWYYKNGKGVPKNLDEAAKWWLKAAEQDYPAAQYSLGFDCYDQIGGRSEALKWIQRAADNRHQQAQGYLGFMYCCGSFGLPRDSVAGYKWLLLATENNSRLQPRILRKTIGLFMSHAKRSRAEQLARDWKVNHSAPER